MFRMAQLKAPGFSRGVAYCSALFDPPVDPPEARLAVGRGPRALGGANMPDLRKRTKAKCWRGHRLAGLNIRKRANGQRECKACAKERSAIRRARVGNNEPIRSTSPILWDNDFGL